VVAMTQKLLRNISIFGTAFILANLFNTQTVLSAVEPEPIRIIRSDREERID